MLVSLRQAKHKLNLSLELAYSANMDLHRAGKRAEWASVSEDRRNAWQRLGASTNGLLTPANVVTLLGFLLVCIGLMATIGKEYWLAVTLLLVGRWCDVLDGWLAAKTGTKSPLGELLDAGLDKVEVVLAVGVLAVTDLVPIWVMVIVLLPQLIISAIALQAVARQEVLHPNPQGKFSMAVAWLALSGFVLLQVSGTEDVAKDGSLLWWAFCMLALISSILGVGAISAYLRQYRRAKR